MSVNEPAHEYTADEREAMLVKMRSAAARFYRDAVHTNYHQFVELTGFMNEIIKVCEAMHGRGEDFPTRQLVLAPHHVDYLREKLECIFGDQLFAETP